MVKIVFWVLACILISRTGHCRPILGGVVLGCVFTANDYFYFSLSDGYESFVSNEIVIFWFLSYWGLVAIGLTLYNNLDGIFAPVFAIGVFASVSIVVIPTVSVIVFG